jgi:hypothetical protein
VRFIYIGKNTTFAVVFNFNKVIRQG